MDTREQIENAIEQMLEAGEKINASRVASRIGISHSLIYNRYPDLRVRIDKLKLDQQSDYKRQAAEVKVSELQEDLQKLKYKVKSLESNEQGYKEQNKKLWEHLQQVYFMYDQVLAERNEFAQKLKHFQ